MSPPEEVEEKKVKMEKGIKREVGEGGDDEE